MSVVRDLRSRRFDDRWSKSRVGSYRARPSPAEKATACTLRACTDFERRGTLVRESSHVRFTPSDRLRRKRASSPSGLKPPNNAWSHGRGVTQPARFRATRTDCEAVHPYSATRRRHRIDTQVKILFVAKRTVEMGRRRARASNQHETDTRISAPEPVGSLARANVGVRDVELVSYLVVP